MALSQLKSVQFDHYIPFATASHGTVDFGEVGIDTCGGVNIGGTLVVAGSGAFCGGIDVATVNATSVNATGSGIFCGGIDAAVVSATNVSVAGCGAFCGGIDTTAVNATSVNATGCGIFCGGINTTVVDTTSIEATSGRFYCGIDSSCGRFESYHIDDGSGGLYITTKNGSVGYIYADADGKLYLSNT